MSHSPRLLRGALLLAVAAVVGLVSAAAVQAQGISLPPSGGNQRASVTQHIGLVEVRIDYSSPDVTGPQGQDRRGQIWGQLVPWGLANLGFGTSTAAPWRAGANENTVFTVSHDVLVQGEELPAGSYGFHVIPREDGPWTLIFSHDSTSWGSFFYDPSEDALRVEATPEPAPFREWLTYDFVDRQQSRATVALWWEELRLPFTVEVPDGNEIYIARIRQELRNSPGFSWQAWDAAANFVVSSAAAGQGGDLEEALVWAETAIGAPFVGAANFTTLSTKARVQAAMGDRAAAAETLRAAVEHPTATPAAVHTLARTLQGQGDTESAVAIFKLNAERFGDEVWPVTVGLARAYSAEGDYDKALEYARIAREQAPDPLNQGNLDAAIQLIEEGKDFNLTN